ncbi:MAG: PAS domain S-box protein, partial [Melioribacteraceae bacterium]|nr:PAS domain S-box protein [Melioribacteraceae bacterium]
SMERDTYLDFSNVSILTSWTTVYQGVFGNIKTINNLNGKRVAVMKGDFNAQMFQRMAGEFDIVVDYIWVDQPLDVLAKVEANEADAAVINNIAGMINDHMFEVKHTSIFFNPFDSYFVTAQGKNVELLHAIDEHIKMEKRDTNSYYHSRLNYWFSNVTDYSYVNFALIYGFCGFLCLLFVVLYFREKHSKAPARISLIYLFIGVTWIIVSDKGLIALNDPKFYSNIQTFKGLIFVLITTGLIFFLIRRSLIKLRTNEERYGKVIQTVPHGVIELNLDGYITLANTTFFEMLGYKNGELIGQYIVDFVDRDDKKDVKALLALIKDSVEPKIHPWIGKVKTRPGRSICVEVSWDYIYNDDGKLAGTVAVIVDITEKRKAEKRAIVANEILHLLNKSADIDITIQKCLELIKDELHMTGVAIRLSDNDDYPYFKSEGLEELFKLKDRCLVALRDNSCTICSKCESCDKLEDCEKRENHKCVPILDCLCGCVIANDIEIAPNHFTEKGSFWLNDLPNFFRDLPIDKKKKYHIWSTCEIAGFKSTCLIPLRFGTKTIGLLQLSDRRKNIFTLDVIKYYEGIADSLGIALYRRITAYELKRSEETLNAIFNAAPIGMGLIKDRIFGITNKHLGDLVGYSPSELAGKNARILYPSQEEYDRVGREKHRDVRKYGIGWIETQFKHKSGNVIDILLSSGLVGDEGEMVFTCLDITERKKAERLIKEQTEFVESLLSTTDALILVLDGFGRVIRFNRACEDITGCRFDHIKGGKLWDCVMVKNENDDVINCFQTGDFSNWPGTFQNQWCSNVTGKCRWITWSTNIIRNPVDEKILYIIGTGLDITESKKAQRKIAESEEKFRLAFETSPDAIVISRNSDGSYVSVNDGFIKITGYSREEIVGQKFPEFTIWNRIEDRDRFYDQLKRDGEVTNFEAPFKIKDGSILHGLMSAKIMHIDGEEHLIVVSRDITNWKNTQRQLTEKEQQLRRAVKMEAVGTLAGGIAHDFNNILQIIGGNVQVMSLEAAQDDEKKQYQVLTDAVDRGASLVRSLLTFSRNVESNLEPTNLNKVISTTHKLLDRVAVGPVKIDIKLILDGKIDDVMIDSAQMDQVITNLVLNAKDAMSEGGKVVIKTEMIDCDELFCSSHPDLKEGRHVVLIVSDSGTGIDSDNLERIFDPFFTTKEMGKGTGLGLAVVYGIVKSHHGHISCYSEEGIGTEFKIYLPSIGETEGERKTVELEQEIVGGTETILVVDDEGPIRDLAKKVFEKYGYSTVLCDD